MDMSEIVSDVRGDLSWIGLKGLPSLRMEMFASTDVDGVEDSL